MLHCWQLGHPRLSSAQRCVSRVQAVQPSASAPAALQQGQQPALQVTLSKRAGLCEYQHWSHKVCISCSCWLKLPGPICNKVCCNKTLQRALQASVWEPQAASSAAASTPFGAIGAPATSSSAASPFGESTASPALLSTPGKAYNGCLVRLGSSHSTLPISLIGSSTCAGAAANASNFKAPAPASSAALAIGAAAPSAPSFFHAASSAGGALLGAHSTLSAVLCSKRAVKHHQQSRVAKAIIGNLLR